MWEKRHSSSRNLPYYFNRETGESQWDPPTSQQQSNVVHVLHLLVKHAGSRRPSSWREERIVRSLQEARDLAKGYRSDLLSGGDNESLTRRFKELAGRVSDCSSARAGGDLGPFGPGAMQPAFERASFALAVGDLSDLVETDSGVHLILRLQ